MKRYIALVSVMSSMLALYAQNNINRDVTVEHEYRPTIAESRKVESKPIRKATKRNAAITPTYSDTTPSLEADAEEKTSLAPQTSPVVVREPGHGTIEAGVGHVNSLLRARYDYQFDKKNKISAWADHEAEWGIKADSKSAVGMDYHYTGKDIKYFASIQGTNDFFTYSGRYFNHEKWNMGGMRFSDLKKEDMQTIWQLHVATGIQSVGNKAFGYSVGLDYNLFDRIGSIVEHTITETVKVNYKWDEHKVGLNLKQMNFLYKLQGRVLDYYVAYDIPHNNRHAFRIEPNYEWRNSRIFIHAGINLDFNIGKGYQYSASNETTEGPKQVAFAPSPNVRFEALLHPKYVLYYLDANGTLGTSSSVAYFGLNKYKDPGMSLKSHHVSSYRPVVVETGFRFQALQSLLLSVHAGYELAKNTAVHAMWAMPMADMADLSIPINTRVNAGFGEFIYCNYQRWKVGGAVDYHYRDILDLKIWGDWYAYRDMKTDKGDKMTVYDRPNWELGTKIVGHIDEHWSVYTWDTFKGKRTNMVHLTADMTPTWMSYNRAPDETIDVKLPAFIDVNLGAGYQFAHTGNEMLDHLSLAAELRNFIHRKNMLWYGYEEQGINFLLKAKWSF